MIAPTIWQDPDFGELDPDGQVLVIGLISNADDEGRLRAHSAYLKSIIFVYKDYTVKYVEEVRNKVVSKMKNIILYNVNGEDYIQLKNWDKYQTQREDRVVASIFPSPRSRTVADICQTDDRQVTAEVKLSKDKVSKVKLREESRFGEFNNVFLTDIEFNNLLEVLGDKNTNSLIAELSSYMESTGKKYKSHYATLQNWARRKYQQHMDKTKKTNIIGL